MTWVIGELQKEVNAALCLRTWHGLTVIQKFQQNNIAGIHPRTMRKGLRTPIQFMENHVLKSKANCGREIKKNKKHNLRQSKRVDPVFFLKPNRNFAKRFKMPESNLILPGNSQRSNKEKRGKMYHEQSCLMQTRLSSLRIP